MPEMPIINNFVNIPFNYQEEPIVSNNSMQCGVDMPNCPEETKCMNGYCVSLDIPVMKGKGLRVVP